ncbi:MAG: Sfum_1244 family protein [Hylemonella sp.]
MKSEPGARPDPALVEAVQTNCHIADASHATEMSLCIYLLQMREFFRWERGLAPLAPIAREAVGAWLYEREDLWSRLENQPWRTLRLAGTDFDPFDVSAINAVLAKLGLVYGAGYLAPGRANFFLADLESAQEREGMQLLVCAREHARGLNSPPAALANHTIYLRRESLQRWLWQKYEAWTLRRPAGAFESALQAYGYPQDVNLALERMAQAQAESLILHELGEAGVEQLLGPAWRELRAGVQDRRTELQLRAVRDLLADCEVTLPALLDRQDDASLHFWFANFEGLRPSFFPRLAQAYNAWREGDGGLALRQAIAAGATHWRQICLRSLDLYQARSSAAPGAIQALLAQPASVLH